MRRMDAERRGAREGLSASEERIRLILDSALDALVTIDHTGTITGWSRQAETLFGWSAGEALGRLLSETIIPERYRAEHTQGLERYLATGEGPLLNRRIEVSALRRDQNEFPMELAITPIRSGNSVSFSAFVRDVTERKRAEAALRESQELLEGIVNSSDDAIISKTLGGIITSWNPGAERLFGYTAQQAIGRPMLMIFPPERKGEEPGILARIGRGERVDHFETVRVRADGKRIDISATISPLRDADGRIIGASKIARDITERKAHERKLQAQLARLHLLEQITRAIGERQDLHSIFRVAIHSLEEHLPIDFGCIALHEVAGQPLEIACVGTRSQALAPELALAEHAQIGSDENGLGRCLRGELVYEPDISASPFPLPGRLARGGLRALVIAPLSVENKVFGVMIAARREPASFASADCEFLRQLSEHLALAARQVRLHSALQQAYEDLRQSQQTVMQQERLRALGQMASGIAHDINNALSPASIYAQSLLERDETLSESARESLRVIHRAIDDVGQTVSRMRMFYSQREPQLALAPLDLNDLLQQVARLTRARWSDIPQERGIVIDLKTDLAPDLPRIMGAESEIRDALTNLVLNAVDAMPEGGTLTLRTGVSNGADREASAAPQVQVEIRDTGVGMTEAVRSRCLEPFFTTKGERGTGLGLAMVYGMVQRHSAELEIESELGAGTTMRVIFPTAWLRDAQQPAPRVRAPRRLRILLVDDDPLLLKSLQDVLESDGHSVLAVDGGQRGIDEFSAARKRAEGFEAVITDLGMPNVDGRTVAAAVKSAAPDTPVVLLTGWGQRMRGEGELPDHVDRVLSKPPRLPELRAALEELVERAFRTH
ncbi:MAG: PAS domain S-box protein [Gammaproteobacteria bacterium]|nr:MAG: PAS domain S-box protein [Gammaproteobacteria bacterium]